MASAAPGPALAPYVRRYVQRSFDLGTEELIEPVVARLGTMLEFQFHERYAVPAYADGKPNPCPAATIIGPITYRRVRLLIRGRVEALAILFQPLGFHQLFGIPTAPLAEIGTDAHAVLGQGVSHLHQRLGELATFSERVTAVEAYLTAFVRKMRPDPVQVCLQRLFAPFAPASVSELASDLGVNLRRLQRKALDYAGVRPTQLIRVARFQRALRLSAEDGGSLTDVAHAADYYDQPHMVREFRRMAGTTPSQAIATIAPGHLISF